MLFKTPLATSLNPNPEFVVWLVRTALPADAIEADVRPTAADLLRLPPEHCTITVVDVTPNSPDDEHTIIITVHKARGVQ